MDLHSIKKAKGRTNKINKKKNLKGVGLGRSDVYHSKRGILKMYRRHSHHSRRNVIKNGISDGANTYWLPSTSSINSHNLWRLDTAFDSFKKWKYTGDICKVVHNKKSSEDIITIKKLVEEYPNEIEQIKCKYCRFYFQKVKEFPDILNHNDTNHIKELYRNRYIKHL